jgi:succinyl-diaminopimelate desuccinylase
MKGGIVSIIGIIKYLLEQRLFLDKFKLVFIGTADEEAGMSGSKFLSENDVINGGNLLVITEPTNLEIGVAEKGVLWSRIIIKGKAAHGSMPHKGINAIENAAKIIPKLHSCLQEKTNPILGNSTLNIGKIEGGSAINVVPEKVELDLDFRLIPEQDPRIVIQNLNNLDPSPCSMEITTPVQLPALKTDLDNEFIENLKKFINKEFIGLSYATDAAYLVNPKDPIPFVLFGPGDPARIHKVNEYVPLSQVYDCSEYLLKSLIKTFIK